jgi:hypothetical protein
MVRRSRGKLELMTESTRLEGVHCAMEIRRPAAGVVVVEISGSDVGELGDAPFHALDPLVDREPGLALFVDARRTRGVSIGVSGAWADWLMRRREDLGAVTMLPGSKLVRMTAEFVGRFAGLESLMEITTDPSGFDDALAAATRD